MKLACPAVFALAALAALPAHAAKAPKKPAGLEQIQTVVVLYGENRSFDNLYGSFPGANGIANAKPENLVQRELDGTVMATLPPVWQKAKVPDPQYPLAMPNGPFQLDAPPINLPLSAKTRDLTHRFYQNQMQIDGGKNDMFVAVSDAG
ncbi:MAG TPA: alkaline phosphatase family protein, partial [Telluria sp.]|nr:alkaline phosphatase family protein [Telluria sp.]